MKQTRKRLINIKNGVLPVICEYSLKSLSELARVSDPNTYLLWFDNFVVMRSELLASSDFTGWVAAGTYPRSLGYYMRHKSRQIQHILDRDLERVQIDYLRVDQPNEALWYDQENRLRLDVDHFSYQLDGWADSRFPPLLRIGGWLEFVEYPSTEVTKPELRYATSLKSWSADRVVYQTCQRGTLANRQLSSRRDTGSKNQEVSNGSKDY